MWMPPACGRISTRLWQGGEGGPGARSVSGRIWDENPSAGGRPRQAVAFVLTPGQRHEAAAFQGLMNQGAVKREEAGRPRIKPTRVCGDKGYSSGKIRSWLTRKGIRYTIPRKRNERKSGPFDRGLYRSRNVVDRTINRLKQFRRTATRYEKEAQNYMAMLQIGSLLLWL